ncbi:MAG TPA: hypothetical protein VH912_20215 [Streptosporangiaceae bacterium]|jgi:hypothetical protein
MADNIVVHDSDDRPERMVRDPKRYFAEARRRAEIEVRRNGRNGNGHRHRTDGSPAPAD